MPIPVSRLREIVVAAIATAAELPPEEITEELNLFDLGLDSLDLAGILIDIEDGMGTEVPVEVLDRFLDVGDAVTIGEVVAVMTTWDPAAPGAVPVDYGRVVITQEDPAS